MLLPAAGDDEASLLVRLERLERRFAIAGDPTASCAGHALRASASLQSRRLGPRLRRAATAPTRSSPAPVAGAGTGRSARPPLRPLSDPQPLTASPTLRPLFESVAAAGSAEPATLTQPQSDESGTTCSTLPSG